MPCNLRMWPARQKSLFYSFPPRSREDRRHCWSSCCRRTVSHKIFPGERRSHAKRKHSGRVPLCNPPSYSSSSSWPTQQNGGCWSCVGPTRACKIRWPSGLRNASRIETTLASIAPSKGGSIDGGVEREEEEEERKKGSSTLPISTSLPRITCVCAVSRSPRPATAR